MISFDTGDSREICYANETISATFRYEDYNQWLVLLSFSATFHAGFLLLLHSCAVKFGKYKKDCEEEAIVQDESPTEATLKPVEVFHRRLGRFLSLVNIKL